MSHLADILIGVALLIILVAGLVSNIVSISVWSYWQPAIFRKTSMFLAKDGIYKHVLLTLCVADLSCILLHILSVSLSFSQSDTPRCVSSLLGLVGDVFGVWSDILVIVLSVLRYAAVTRPYSVHTDCSHLCQGVSVTTALVISIAQATPLGIVTFEKNDACIGLELGKLFSSETGSSRFEWITLVVQCAVVVLIFCVLVVLDVLQIRALSSLKEVSSTETDITRRQKVKIHTSEMFLSLTLLITLKCLLVAMINSLFIIQDWEESVSIALKAIRNSLNFLAASIKIVFYIWFGDRFWLYIQELYCEKIQRLRQYCLERNKFVIPMTSKVHVYY